ncbi:hypothetical protein B0H15DRAFT_812636 [Mycena belliarum]|uniref:Inner centromere protein ARK-binding domain-containing protein n=1 Tax=Mycena belliarum TaxID=1033014 RepID=A0AAD6UHQ2_9AGAR|nr:hypothetical protein B0H15DRAFT_812636 [Mycena belliae]
MEPAAAMDHGLLDWCNSTRFTMANDPGRQLFQDQIQTHGFLFLTDYLDNILAGPRRDPLIELVKTPGRKKTTSKRPVATPSTLRTGVTLSLEDGNEADCKENAAPVNDFHRALLKAKEKSPPPGYIHHSPAPLHDVDLNPGSPVVPPLLVTPVQPPADVSGELVELVAKRPNEPQLLEALLTDQNDLSVIAEDEEPERSCVSLPGSTVIGGAEAQIEVVEQAAAQVNTPESTGNQVPSSPPGDIFQTAPVSPSQLATPVDVLPPSAASNDPPQSPAIPSTVSWPQSSPTSQAAAENHTAPLPEIPPWHPRATHHDITEPLPPVVENVIDVGMPDVATRPSSPKGPAHKPSAPSFPSLPAPLPFRKSMKAPDPSAAHGPLGTVTPGGALGGKRTSWLMRAREVKALEITVKKPIPAPSVTSGVPSGSKRKSGDVFGLSGITGLEEEERRPKAVKTVEGDVAPTKLKAPDSAHSDHEGEQMQPQLDNEEQEGLLVQLKRTVDGLGARFGKSMGKSLGGAAAANALAEARAAAEARIAERHHKEEEATMALGAPAVAPSSAAPEESAVQRVFHPTDAQPRLSLSELVTSSERNSKAIFEAKPLPLAPSPSPAPDSHSPVVFHMAPAPVFNKPPPVFVPPAPAPSQAPAFKLPTTTAFSMPASMALGLASRLPSPKQASAVPLSAQSTMESIQSDVLFDSQDGVPAWLPSTQDTEYTSGFGSQSQCSPPHGPMTELDEDDSWPLDEKLASGVPWFNVNGKEDSMTWSTLPTESQRGDTGPVPLGDLMDESPKKEREFHQIPGSFNMDLDEEDEEDEEDGDVVLDQSVVGEMEIDPQRSTVSLVDPAAVRSQSQMSMASSASSQSQGGFLGHASKLMNSMLGNSKKVKPEVKSLQLAAVAAKRQQEEKEKKANRLKEMESRRQAALQRKADEEKTKAQDEERRLKEESERRKKDREEHTDKRPLKTVAPKKEEETGKKRKIIGETDKKPELKKSILKPTLAASTSLKHLSKSALTKPQTALASSATYNAASTSKVAEGGPSKPSTFPGKGKLTTKNMVPDDDISQPSQILQTQMAARAKAQLQAANLAPPTIASESIELPDINSEYSDSDDEDRPRTFDPPSWAQSPDLRQALEMQSTINPDDVFGAIRPLRMDELFRNRTGRFRARTSSANWTGTDRLTVEEEREYVRRMGFQ